MIYYSKEQEVKSETSVSSHKVPLSHGVRTDPSQWISTSETSETPTFAEPQNAPPAPYGKNEILPITTQPGLHESSLALSGEQDPNIKKEDAPLVTNPLDKLKWEVLVQEVVSADQSLARTLYPITNRKTALMLMEQLLSEDNLLMEEHYKKKQEQKVNNPETAAHR